jgi:hypothetical protein
MTIRALVIAVIATNLLTVAGVYYVNGLPIGDEKNVYCPAQRGKGFLNIFYPVPLMKPRVLDCRPANGALLCEPAAGQ